MEQDRDEPKLYVVMFDDGTVEAVSEIFLSPVLAEMYKEKYQLQSPQFTYYVMQMILYDNCFIRSILKEFEER